MLKEICGDFLPESRNMDYLGFIEANGGCKTVATKLLRHVVPEILELQNQQVTTKLCKGSKANRAIRIGIPQWGT